MSDTIKDHLGLIADLAVKAFAEHEMTVVTEDEDGQTFVYRCRKPGSWAYSFTVIFRPGFVAVTGDTGDIVLNHSDGDSRSWVQRQHAPYFDYMLKKRPHGCRPPDEFMSGEVDLWLKERIEECGGDNEDVSSWRDARREWIRGDRLPDDAVEIVQDVYGDTEVVDRFYAPNSTSVWGCHALMCWKRLSEARTP